MICIPACSSLAPDTQRLHPNASYIAPLLPNKQLWVRLLLTAWLWVTPTPPWATWCTCLGTPTCVWGAGLMLSTPTRRHWMQTQQLQRGAAVCVSSQERRGYREGPRKPDTPGAHVRAAWCAVMHSSHSQNTHLQQHTVKWTVYVVPQAQAFGLLDLTPEGCMQWQVLYMNTSWPDLTSGACVCPCPQLHPALHA